ncbi:hypothetical protein M430DRAFT_94501 [Amorphotheca resinae ATCC 22711]|uniref:DUF1445 domain-containing protein n=1 Tax=Amorphotheca resinae ATCC 22711 TaxID=857342 RepID=A0A2T3BGI3_AMORE|nr:hypothetical protein M430DRAFT_94501 [Amorphotheca resinae ATCC 22711]PSS28474.1 hypothetical protein M430DRAFT_94501 [Amorphotheca resinae ATCC 22711]
MVPIINLPATGAEARIAARNNTYTTSTSGIANTFLQANLIVLPSRFASDFRLLCLRNPVPCPLLAESARVGCFDELKSWLPGIEDSRIAAGIDIRRDAPRYMVYEDGELKKFQCADIVEEWSEDHVAFLIGCSYSFENALTAAGLPPRHAVMGRNVPMYRTRLPLCPAGIFTGATYVVSMRMYKRSEVETVRDVTRPYVATHGEPIAWGWEAVKELGIEDIHVPEWGDAPLTLEGKHLSEEDKDMVPVFWGCGVTPQEAVMKAKLPGVVLGHAPGHMIVVDVREWEVLEEKNPN